MQSLKEIAEIFGSYTKAQEILYLIDGAKDVVRQGFYENELPKVQQFCKENRIFLVKSSFKVILTDRQAYSNKGERVSVSEEKGMYFVYLSLDDGLASLASLFEEQNNIKYFGRLLG